MKTEIAEIKKVAKNYIAVKKRDRPSRNLIRGGLNSSKA
jgi:hypothetical protein